MSFYNEIQKYNWEEVRKQIYSKTEADVKRALEKEKIDLHDFQALISPAATACLEAMAQKKQTAHTKAIWQVHPDVHSFVHLELLHQHLRLLWIQLQK